jgi:2,4-dienoyl-CoA reductase-like NADH-dependent reductase (Old Yellow Enzyme family)
VYPRIAQFKSPDALHDRLTELGLQLPLEDHILSASEESPLAEPLQVGKFTVGNRWCIHPMEGWDGNADGTPSEHTLRRWRNFGRSGAKLIWGGEAAAVQPEGRANPNQILATAGNRIGLAQLQSALLNEHKEHCGTTDDLLIGLQLTHSGRFSRPDHRGSRPRIMYHHPLLDAKFHLDSHDDSIVLTDNDLQQLIDDFVAAARLAESVGFRFVDVKACHGYLLHESLSAYARPGRYGGDFDGRTRLLREVIAAVRAACPRLLIGVRLSIFDTIPYQTSREIGRPIAYTEHLPYQFGFGVNASDPQQMDLAEPIQLLRLLQADGAAMVNISCGSPYYCPHVQRPALFPPSDGYQPPEDPLVGVCRQIHAAKECKWAVPDLPMVGTGYSYLQDYLPHVAQAVVRAGWIDSVGLGRMVLSYPKLPSDVLSGKSLARKQVCRTFSDCTTAPRNQMVSGCYPLDPYYKALPEAQRLKQMKQSHRQPDETDAAT